MKYVLAAIILASTTSAFADNISICDAELIKNETKTLESDSGARENGSTLTMKLRKSGIEVTIKKQGLRHEIEISRAGETLGVFGANSDLLTATMLIEPSIVLDVTCFPPPPPQVIIAPPPPPDAAK
jgi:hypothetical protein